MTLSARAWTSSGGFFDVPAGREELNRIEAQASSPDFWSDQEAAQKLLQDRSRLEKQIERQEHFESEVADAEVLFEFAEVDESSLKELQPLLERLEHEFMTRVPDVTDPRQRVKFGTSGHRGRAGESPEDKGKGAHVASLSSMPFSTPS